MMLRQKKHIMIMFKKMTASITLLSIVILSKMRLSIMKDNKTNLSIFGLVSSLSINDTKPNVMLSIMAPL